MVKMKLPSASIEPGTSAPEVSTLPTRHPRFIPDVVKCILLLKALLCLNVAP